MTDEGKHVHGSESRGAKQRAEVVPVQLDAQAVADALVPTLKTALATQQQQLQQQHLQQQQLQTRSHDSMLWTLVIALGVLAALSVVCALVSLWVAATNARTVSKLQALLLAK